MFPFHVSFQNHFKFHATLSICSGESNKLMLFPSMVDSLYLGNLGIGISQFIPYMARSQTSKRFSLSTGRPHKIRTLAQLFFLRILKVRTCDSHIANGDKFLIWKASNAHIAVLGCVSGHKRTYGLYNQLTFCFYNLSSARSRAVSSVLQRTHGLYSVLSALMGWIIRSQK